jgi:hypothetical protein
MTCGNCSREAEQRIPSAQELMLLMMANWAETCSELQKRRRRVNITEVAHRWKK